MTKRKMSEAKYNEMSLEFDLCQTECAEEINKFISGLPWEILPRHTKIRYMTIAKRIESVIEKYYELVPTFWKE